MRSLSAKYTNSHVFHWENKSLAWFPLYRTSEVRNHGKKKREKQEDEASFNQLVEFHTSVSLFSERFGSSGNLTTTFVRNCRSHKRSLSVLDEMKPMFDLPKDCHYERKWSKSAPTTADFKRQARIGLCYRCEPNPSSTAHSQKTKIRQPPMQMTLLVNVVWKEEIPCQIKPCLQAPDHTAEQSIWNVIFSDQPTACHPFIRAEGTHVSLFREGGHC